MSDPDKSMVLLVDDRAENLLAYQAILGEMGLELVTARTGADALKQVLLHDFAVILLDVNMPVMDGFETARLVRNRKRSAHTPIIFVTAFPDEFRAAEGYAHGAVDYLLTPVVPDVLRAKVKVFVELFRMAEELQRRADERVALVEERTKRAAAEEANRRLRFVAEVTAVLGKSLDDDVTVRDLARLTVPELGDRSVIVRRDPGEEQWHVTQASLADGQVSVAEFADLDSLPSSFLPPIERLLFDRADAPSAQSDAGPLVDPRTVLFPLRAPKSALAVFGLIREPSRPPFTAADLAIAEALASRAAVALENAQLYKDLEHADQQKNEFLSMLAHELRNPLAPIRTSVDVLRLHGQDDPEVDWALGVIDRQVTHLVRLVDDLLDVSRITGGKIRLELECLDVAAIVTAAVETSRPLIEAGEHRLTVSLPEEPLRVNCDRVRLSQILANLLNNAAKYTPQGGSIDVSALRDGTEAVFRIRDNGMGIPPEMLSKIFDLFTQVDRSIDRAQGGLGIGLTLVRRLVELHGGRVEARSEGLNRGSEFVIRLPAVDATASEPRAPAPGKSQGQTHRLRVLVVDDNVDAADSVAWLLRLNEHQVRTTHDGSSAVTVARSFRPHAVVLDLGLPKLDGYEVARQLRASAETRHALLLAVSGYAQDEHRRRSTEAGFDHHFVKPISFDVLLSALASAGPPQDAN